MRRGIFVALEGLDGAGTTTQSRLLQQHILTDLGFPGVSLSWEPGTSKYGLLIRKILKKEVKADPLEIAQLYVLDSVEHNKHELKPVRERGGIAISDRYRPSSFAYQTADGVSFAAIWELHEREGDRLEIPDLTYFLNLDARISMQRLERRNNAEGTAPELFDGLEFQARVNDNYLAAIREGLKYFGKVVMIEGTGSKEEIRNEINKSFDEFYRQWAKSD